MPDFIIQTAPAYIKAYCIKVLKALNNHCGSTSSDYLSSIEPLELGFGRILSTYLCHHFGKSMPFNLMAYERKFSIETFL